jgi:arylformamidase
VSRRFVELSHPIAAGMETYRGLPAPVVSDFLSREASVSRYAAGTTFQIGRVEMVVNTGTYVDAPFHRFETGTDIAGLSLERLADLEGVLIDASARRGRSVDAESFAGCKLAGIAVLVRTDWARYWGKDAYFGEYPFLTRRAAEVLADAGPALVGIDSINIDDAGDGERPVHTALLRAGIPILEHLCNLDALPPRGFRLHAVPAPFRGVGSFPVRAYALLEGEDG